MQELTLSKIAALLDESERKPESTSLSVPDSRGSARHALRSIAEDSTVVEMNPRPPSSFSMAWTTGRYVFGTCRQRCLQISLIWVTANIHFTDLSNCNEEAVLGDKELRWQRTECFTACEVFSKITPSTMMIVVSTHSSFFRSVRLSHRKEPSAQTRSAFMDSPDGDSRALRSAWPRSQSL
jgi:hypothetical protein